MTRRRGRRPDPLRAASLRDAYLELADRLARESERTASGWPEVYALVVMEEDEPHTVYARLQSALLGFRAVFLGEGCLTLEACRYLGLPRYPHVVHRQTRRRGKTGG